MFTNRWVDNQIVTYLYSGILFISNKKEGTIETHNNISEFQNNYDE